MTTNDESSFRARPRRPGDIEKQRARHLAELARLRSRFDRAARDGHAAFLEAESDGYDIGAFAVISLADFVLRELPTAAVGALPPESVDELRATRDIVAHNYAALDNTRLWLTVTEHAPHLLDEIERALNEL